MTARRKTKQKQEKGSLVKRDPNNTSPITYGETPKSLGLKNLVLTNGVREADNKILKGHIMRAENILHLFDQYLNLAVMISDSSGSDYQDFYDEAPPPEERITLLKFLEEVADNVQALYAWIEDRRLDESFSSFYNAVEDTPVSGSTVADYYIFLKNASTAGGTALDSIRDTISKLQELAVLGYGSDSDGIYEDENVRASHPAAGSVSRGDYIAAYSFGALIQSLFACISNIRSFSIILGTNAENYFQLGFDDVGYHPSSEVDPLAVGIGIPFEDFILTNSGATVTGDPSSVTASYDILTRRFAPPDIAGKLTDDFAISPVSASGGGGYSWSPFANKNTDINNVYGKGRQSVSTLSATTFDASASPDKPKNVISTDGLSAYIDKIYDGTSLDGQPDSALTGVVVGNVGFYSTISSPSTIESNPWVNFSQTGIVKRYTDMYLNHTTWYWHQGDGMYKPISQVVLISNILKKHFEE